MTHVHVEPDDVLVTREKVTSLVHAWLREDGHAVSESEDGPGTASVAAQQLQSRPARLGLGAAYLPHSAVAASTAAHDSKVQKRVLGKHGKRKRRKGMYDSDSDSDSDEGVHSLRGSKRKRPRLIHEDGDSDSDSDHGRADGGAQQAVKRGGGDDTVDGEAARLGKGAKRPAAAQSAYERLLADLVKTSAGKQARRRGQDGTGEKRALKGKSGECDPNVAVAEEEAPPEDEQQQQQPGRRENADTRPAYASARSEAHKTNLEEGGRDPDSNVFKRKRKKKRSKQKNRRKDNRPAHLKPGWASGDAASASGLKSTAM